MSPDPELTYKIIKIIKMKAENSRSKTIHKFTSKDIARKLGEKIDLRRVNAIMKNFIHENIIEYNKNSKQYSISIEKMQKIINYENKLKNTLILSYHKPLENIEPPINIYKIINDERRLIAQAKRIGILKPIYQIKKPEECTIIFQNYKIAGFIIKRGEEKIFEAYRMGFMKPIEAIYGDKRLFIKRRWGREIMITYKGDIKIAYMRGCGFEKAIFTYERELEEVSIPLSVALFAIKQLDVIL